MLLAIPSAVGLSVLSKTVLLILTTPEIALNGYLITPFICLGVIFNGIYGIVGNILVLDKNTKILGQIWVIMAIMNIILNFIMIPYYGIIGSALATLLCYIFALIVSSIVSKKVMKLPFDMKSTIKIVISSLVMGIVLYILNPIGIIGIIVSILIGIVVYFIVLFVIKGITKDEIKLFKKFLA